MADYKIPSWWQGFVERVARELGAKTPEPPTGGTIREELERAHAAQQAKDVARQLGIGDPGGILPPPTEPPQQHGHGGPAPRRWGVAIPDLVWAVLIFAFGFEGVASLLHGELWPTVFGFVGMIGLTAVLIHWQQIRRSMPLAYAVATLLIVVAMSPVVRPWWWPPSAGDNSRADYWAPLTVAQQDALTVKLRSVPRRSVEIQCGRRTCNELADSLVATFRAVGGWQVTRSKAIGMGSSGAGILIAPGDETGKLIKAALEGVAKVPDITLSPAPDSATNGLQESSTYIGIGEKPLDD